MVSLGMLDYYLTLMILSQLAWNVKIHRSLLACCKLLDFDKRLQPEIRIILPRNHGQFFS